MARFSERRPNPKPKNLSDPLTIALSRAIVTARSAIQAQTHRSSSLGIDF
jgi:hypothetical protein